MPLPRNLERLRTFWVRDIWQAASGRDHSLRGHCYALVRVISITCSGLREMHVAVRAAALSYSSLLSLGPLVALTVLISGFALGGQDPALIAHSLNRIIQFIAPQVAQYERSGGSATPEARPGGIQYGQAPAIAGAQPQSGVQPVAAQSGPELVQLINHFITSSRSGTAGAVGLFTLLLIVIQLFTTVENTFNDIWGVRRGRSWLTRIVYYWTAVTLGAVLFFTSLTLLSAGAFMNVFLEKLPLGNQFAQFFAWLLPSSSVVILGLLLALFYRTVPNTRVVWRAAFIGALVVTILLFLNNYLAFLYFKRVLVNRSLYGSVGIMPILMIGLYIFWFFVLVGGQITYAIQNVHYRSSQAAWHSINEKTREGLSLLVLVLIARRFKDCAPPYSTTEISHLIRVPTQVLNESLNRLCELGLITELPPGEGRDPTEHRYQPARPLGKISLVQFKQLFENYGESPSGEILSSVDPILQRYQDNLAAHLPQSLGEKSLDELIDELPLPTKASLAL
ncbi:MAG: YihY/virulence factor BrkB family protein [Opitutaceae bacterium]|nr:YihY/virulence factor BrkB family protein [Opitutaceae bacterium]